MAKNDFTALYHDLTTRLVGAFEVAEACLRFATLSTRADYAFDSSRWRDLDVADDLCKLIPLHISAVLDPRVLQGIADTIAKSNDRPLAAWVPAMRISVAISQDFTASDPNPSEYTLQDLQGFAVPAKGTRILYRRTSGLSAQPGPDFNQNDPSAVSGLGLWRKVPELHGSFTVVVDKTCGAQFDACIGDDNTLKVALIQPDQNLGQLCVATVSPDSDPKPRFFGVVPRDVNAQTQKIIDDLKLAAAAGAGIALLPELVLTEAMVTPVVAALGTPGNILPPNVGPHTLRVVVSGSYHHVDGTTQRNSTQVHFPRTDPMLHRQHSKSGTFVFRTRRFLMEAWSCDPNVQATSIKHCADTNIVDFREDVKATNEIRLFSGIKFSAVVVICADLLNKTLRRVLETLQPSLVLVCNMTEKLGDFESAAHALILNSQSTLVSVNNPADWAVPLPGGLVGMPLQNANQRIVVAHFPANKILLFEPTRTPPLQAYP